MKKKSVLVLFLAVLLSFHTIMPNVIYADYDEKLVKGQKVEINENDEFFEFVKINDIADNDKAAIRYINKNKNHNNYTVCVNAGHGTSGGMRDEVRTKCHPDGTPKVTGGTTSEGSLTAYAVSDGMKFMDGTREAVATLAEALILKDMLLERGYNVLMIRETDDAQIDNIGRSILANKYADIHVAVHWDATASDKGAYYCKVPDVDSYRNMYPVSELWESHIALGDSLISGLRSNDVKIYNEGYLDMDLTQTSFSKVPSIDIELGDAISDHGEAQLKKLAIGLCNGIDLFFNENPDLANNRKVKSTKNEKTYSGKGLLSNFFDAFVNIVEEIIDFFKFLLGDIPQMIANLLITIPDGTWKDFRTTYKFEDLINEGEDGTKNKYTIVSEGSKNNKYYENIDGNKAEFSRDTEIPVICVDLYQFASGRIKQLDTNFFINKNERTPFVSLVVALIHIIIYLAAAFLIVTLIWHGISIVLSSLNPKEKKEHKNGLNISIKAIIMLVGSIVIMALCIYFSQLLFKDIYSEYADELPIRVNVSGEANYSFSTNAIGYLRYMSDLNSTKMLTQKFLHALFYIVFAIGNCLLLIVMIARFLMLMYLSVMGPIVAALSSIENRKFIKMTYTQWVVKYVIWSLSILVIAIPYRIVLETCFK